jgi:hypothetical protein
MFSVRWNRDDITPILPRKNLARTDHGRIRFLTPYQINSNNKANDLYSLRDHLLFICSVTRSLVQLSVEFLHFFDGTPIE